MDVGTQESIISSRIMCHFNRGKQKTFLYKTRLKNVINPKLNMYVATDKKDSTRERKIEAVNDLKV